MRNVEYEVLHHRQNSVWRLLSRFHSDELIMVVVRRVETESSRRFYQVRDQALDGVCVRERL